MSSTIQTRSQGADAVASGTHGSVAPIPPATRPRGRPKAVIRKPPQPRQPALEPLAVRPAEAARLLGAGRTTMIELMNSGEVESVRVRGMRLVLVESLKQLLARAPRAAGPAKYRPPRKEAADPE
jgi:excisionase family DNA binding protein